MGSTWEEMKRRNGVTTTSNTTTTPAAKKTEPSTSGSKQTWEAMKKRALQQEAAASSSHTSATEKQEKKEREQEPNFFDRLGNVLSGAGRSTASDYTNLGGTATEGLGRIGSRLQDKKEARLAAQDREYLERYKKDLAAAQAAGDEKAAKIAQTRINQAEYRLKQSGALGDYYDRVNQEAVQKIYSKADELSAAAQQDIDEAKEGLGGAGKFLVDAGVAGTQLAGDMALAMLSGGSTTVPMALRVMGGSAQEARQDGATYGQQLAYGAGSALVSGLTEKLGNVGGVFKTAFGAGVLDKALARVAAKPAGKLLAGAISEGGEEFIEALAQPLLQKLTYNPEAAYDEEWLSEALYSAAIGAVLGGGGVAISPSTYAREPRTQIPAAETGTGAQEQTFEGKYTPGAENAAEAPVDALEAILSGGKRVDGSSLTDEQFARAADLQMEGSVGMDAAGRVFRVDPAQHITQRTVEGVGSRTVNAFQFDHPELQTYYKQAAQQLINDASLSLDAPVTRYKERGSQGNRYVQEILDTPALRSAMDMGLSRNDIIKAAEDLIADNGQENNAAAKRLELVLDEMLTNGYTTARGERVAPNKQYVAEKKNVTGYQEKDVEELPIWDMDEGAELERRAVQSAYDAGRANLPRERANLATIAQEDAYAAGRKDAILAMKEPVENEMASEYTGGNKTKEAVSDVYERGEDARVAGFDPGASPEIGDRPGVQEEIGGVGSGIQRSVRLDGTVQTSRLTEDAKSYGVPLEITKPESWPADQADHIAYSVGGKVYVREDFPADKEAELVPHEGTHIMRQKKFKPYMDLLERTADSMNLFSDAAQRLIAAAAKHRGIDVFGMTEDEYDILYDEVNACVSAAVMSGKESVIADDLNNAFNDYAAYREELVSIHEQFKGRKKIDDGLGAANAGFAGEYDRLQRETDEFHPEGENPQRPVDLPVKDFDDRNISRTVRTVMEAGATPDEIVPKIEELVAKGEYSYDAYADETAIKDAARSIEKVGWAQSLADWTKAMERGEVSKKLTATGWALYNNAANSGDTETALTILDYMVKHQRNAAQALQATRILKKLSPETQLYQVQRSVESLQEELNERYGDEKAPELKIDPELAERYMKSKDQTERDEVMKDIYRDIGRQMPSRFIDKWNAWRYLAMLGNPRTHVRNVVGNAGFAPVVAAKNLTATAIESAVSRVSGGKLNRTKSLVGLSKNDRALMKAAWEDFAKIQDAAMSGGKYDDFANANQYIEEGRQIFKFKPLEKARKGNTKAMEKEDMWFSRPHYAAALAGYCKQHGLTPEQIEKGKETKNARAYAIKEAQKATYRDTNALSQTISELGRTRAGETNPVKKGVGVVMQGILPFRKTPANILARGLEYSPVGLMNGIKQAAWDVKRGKKTGAEAIDSISAGFTGTGLLAMGMYLAAQGLIRGHGDDDDKENDFKEMMGHQAYALEVGDTSVTLDWLAPEVLPLFIGVNLWEQTNGADEELTLSAMLNAAKTVTEPLLEMSCLQSLNDVFDSVGYAASEGLDGLPAALASAATSYLTQGLPTILGQAERSGEDVRMTTYTEKNAFLTGDMQYTLGRASARIPGWEYQQIPYIDAWGRTESSGGTGERAFNNFLNPAYTSEINASKMEEELLRLYEQTGEGKILPSRAAKYFTVDGERKDLTAEEYVKYAKKKGQTSYTLLSGLTANSAYKAMDQADKVDAVSKCYEYANAVAKSSVSSFKPDGWVAKAVSASNTTGIKPEQYVTLYIAQGKIESLKNAKGDTIDNSKGLQIMNMIYNTPGLTEKQRQQLFLDFGVGKTVRGYNKSLVEQKLKEMKAKAK